MLRELDVSRETLGRLRLFERLVFDWTDKINLIAPSTKKEIWERHILDSAQIWELRPPGGSRWVDLGSGGGFPGIVIAILAAGTDDDARLTLAESDQRKAVFLRTAIREIELTNVDVKSVRIESLDAIGADVVSARALAPLPKLLGYVHRHLNKGGVALLSKGRTASQEIAEARKTWRFDLSEIPSNKDQNATILRLKRIERV